MFTPLQSSASAPHIPQSYYQSPSQFFLHSQQSMQMPPTQPIPMQSQQTIVPQRRTWAQQAQPLTIGSESSYQQPDMRTWGKPHSAGGGFVLHESTERFQDRFQESPPRYQNGGEHTLNHSSSHPGFTLSQQHQQQQLYTGSHSTPSASPQHRNIHRQISQLMDDSKRTVSLQQIEQPIRKSSITHAPIPAPPVDDMAPQSISFIGNPDDDISEGLSRLNITSGTRTYRIPSPTRPLISRNAFQPSPPLENLKEPPLAEVSSLDNDPTSQKGFYISFDNEQPKRPKPQLRTKKMSPKKERSLVEDEPNYEQIQEALEKEQRAKQLERELEQDRLRKEIEERRKMEYERQRRETSQEREKSGAAAIIIGNELSNPDPELIDEKERKKERIMMLSLQRRQQQEESKQRKEQEAQTRRENEKAKEDQKAKKKEEQAQRIFE